MQDRPQLFSTFLMWLLADLFHDLPEVGDVDKPKLVFFFDEAHLLFDDASKAFLDAIEQTVRLIRSKGVGVFFVTQTPKDVPVRRARPARQPGAARAARLHPRRRQGAQGDRRRPSRTAAYDLEELLTQLGTGEAVVTVLSERGAPTPVAWTRMRAPQSLMAPSPQAVVDAGRRVVAAARRSMPRCVDRESAYERLAGTPGRGACRPTRRPAPAPGPGPAPRERAPKEQESARRSRCSARAPFKSMLRSAGTVLGREITRSLFDTARAAAEAPGPGGEPQAGSSAGPAPGGRIGA